MNNNKVILHAYKAGGKLYGYSFAKSQFYPTSKELILFNYHGGCETLRWLTASQSQLKVIINNPTNYLSNVMRSTG